MARQDGEDGIGPPQEHLQATGTASPIGADGHTIGIRRTGLVVEITLTSANEYASIELYELLVRSAERGALHIELGPSRS